ncbi:unnamed protein product [Effrenium voratum]|nr:unnamed protein product [Effrenium voratum]
METSPVRSHRGWSPPSPKMMARGHGCGPSPSPEPREPAAALPAPPASGAGPLPVANWALSSPVATSWGYKPKEEEKRRVVKPEKKEKDFSPGFNSWGPGIGPTLVSFTPAKQVGPL